MERWQNRYIGLPYLEGGRSLNDGGLDCWGFSRYILHNEAAIELPEFKGIYYDEKKQNRKGLADFITGYDAFSLGWTPTTGPLQPFDLLILTVAGPFHMAVVSEKGWMLHVELGCDSCEERYESARWKRRIHSSWRNIDFMQKSAQTLPGTSHR